MIALVFATCLANLLFAERIPMSEGLGTDGTNYGAIALDFHGSVFEEGVNKYYLQRAAPSAIVHYGLRALGQPVDIPHVIRGYQVLNLALLVLVAVLWRGIADALQLSLGARWLGFVGLFVNYAVIKHAYYMPVFTDVTAFALGATYLYLFLRRRQVALLAATLVGAFAWPVAALSGAVLLLFPRGATDAVPGERRRWANAAALAIALALELAFVYMYYVRGLRKVGQGPTIPPIDALVPLAMLVHGLYLFFAFRGLLDGTGPEYIRRVLQALRPRDVLLAAIAVVLPAVVIKLLATPDVAALNARGFGRLLVYPANGRPFVTFISHVVWFGPVLWLALFHWKQVCDAARRMGPGMLAFLGLVVLISLTPETRQSNLGYPFVVALVASVASAARVPARVTWLLAATGLALSKFWFRINTPEAIAHARSGAQTLSDADSAFFYRNYYLSHSLWMPNRWYAVHAAIVLLVGVATWMLLRHHRARAGHFAPRMADVQAAPGR